LREEDVAHGREPPLLSRALRRHGGFMSKAMNRIMTIKQHDIVRVGNQDAVQVAGSSTAIRALEISKLNDPDWCVGGTVPKPAGSVTSPLSNPPNSRLALRGSVRLAETDRCYGDCAQCCNHRSGVQ